MSTVQTQRTAQKILARTKGLRKQMQTDEEPLLRVAAIWDNGQAHMSKPCNVIITNQRLIGFELVTFPRERLFLEDVPLTSIQSVTLRNRTYDPLFRELAVKYDGKTLYIRAPRKQIEALYTALRLATETSDTDIAQPDFEDEQSNNTATGTRANTRSTVYGRQDIRARFEHSPLAITLLFVGGLVLELIGVVGWILTQNAQVGLPLFIAGFVAVITATLVRRQRG